MTATKSVNRERQPIDVVGWFLRIAVVLTLICLFIPALNPTRMSEMISENNSFFTSGISYGNISSGFKRALDRGYIEQGVLTRTYIGALVALIGMLITTVGCAMTLGEIKLKRLGTMILCGGSAVALAGTVFIKLQQSGFNNAANPDRIKPVAPVGGIIFIVLIGLSFLLALVYLLKLPKATAEDKYEMPAKFRLFLMFSPFIVLIFLFSYLPLWGWRYGFFNYTPGQPLTMDKFVGFKWFAYLFQNQASRADLGRVMVNTLAMSGIGLAMSWLPLAFAIFLTEIGNGAVRRVVQTITTIPNFISWVLAYTVAFALFSSDGFVNQFLLSSGLATESKDFLTGNEGIWFKMWLWNTWKGLGWGSIVYIASISGIDQALYEAATIDGAGRFRKMWYITVPGLMPTFFVQLILAISNILSNGMDQYLVFRNATNRQGIEVLDLYVYQLGLAGSGGSGIPLSTVIGMAKSIIYIIPGIISPYNIILVKTYIESIPGELEESASIDGVGYFTISSRIILPLCKPILATIAIFGAVGHWNSFTDSLILMSGKPELHTLQHKLYTYMNEATNLAAMIQQGSGDIGNLASQASMNMRPIKFTVAMTTVLPILLVYPFLSKYFEKGIMLGAVKG